MIEPTNSKSLQTCLRFDQLEFENIVTAGNTYSYIAGADLGFSEGGG